MSINLHLRFKSSFLSFLIFSLVSKINIEIKKHMPIMSIYTVKTNIPTGTPSWTEVDSTPILCRYTEDKISTNFLVISTYLFRRNFAGREIHVVSTYFFDVISLVEISTFFPRTFFDVISLVDKSTLFHFTFFNVILLVELSTLFASTFSDEILMNGNSTSSLVKLQANENIRGGLPLLVTLKSWLL